MSTSIARLSKARKSAARTPKYAELYNWITGLIESGKLSAGDRIPSENELIAKFGVSNTTARRTLLELKNSGWVRKVRSPKRPPARGSSGSSALSRQSSGTSPKISSATGTVRK